jgi:hypothetical protein
VSDKVETFLTKEANSHTKVYDWTYRCSANGMVGHRGSFDGAALAIDYISFWHRVSIDYLGENGSLRIPFSREQPLGCLEKDLIPSLGSQDIAPPSRIVNQTIRGSLRYIPDKDYLPRPQVGNQIQSNKSLVSAAVEITNVIGILSRVVSFSVHDGTC